MHVPAKVLEYTYIFFRFFYNSNRLHKFYMLFLSPCQIGLAAYAAQD